MRKLEVWELCRKIAPAHGLEPLFFLALCEQESINLQKPDEYCHDAARLENGFYHRYTQKQNFATTSEVLLAVSYGLTQMMGQSLLELGYFEWYLDWHNFHNSDKLVYPRSQVSICKGIDDYMLHSDWHVERGCQWFERKLKTARGDETKALLLWNGGGDPGYPEKVIARMNRLRGEVSP